LGRPGDLRVPADPQAPHYGDGFGRPREPLPDKRGCTLGAGTLTWLHSGRGLKMKGFLWGRTSVILGVWAGPRGFRTIQKGGGGFAPNLFGGVPRPRGPAQTPQMTDSRPPNKSFILSPRPERSHVKAVWPEIIGSVFGQVPPWSPKLSGPTAGGSSCSAGCAKNQPGRLPKASNNATTPS
jgi:hypothetical protein